jgi:hypothetical protein
MAITARPVQLAVANIYIVSLLKSDIGAVLPQGLPQKLRISAALVDEG